MSSRDFWLTVLFGFIAGLNVLYRLLPGIDLTVMPFWLALLLVLAVLVAFAVPSVVAIKVVWSGRWRHLSGPRLLLGAVVASVMLMTGDQGTSTVSVPRSISIVATAWIFVVNVVIVYWMAGLISSSLFGPREHTSKT